MVVTVVSKTISLSSSLSGATIMDIPKKPGIYLSNGKYYQTKNLYKKAKKLHDFQVIEISDSDDCADLDNMLKKYN